VAAFQRVSGKWDRLYRGRVDFPTPVVNCFLAFRLPSKMPRGPWAVPAIMLTRRIANPSLSQDEIWLLGD
jgi:hypothetical protein